MLLLRSYSQNVIAVVLINNKSSHCKVIVSAQLTTTCLAYINSQTQMERSF